MQLIIDTDDLFNDAVRRSVLAMFNGIPYEDAARLPVTNEVSLKIESAAAAETLREAVQTLNHAVAEAANLPAATGAPSASVAIAEQIAPAAPAAPAPSANEKHGVHGGEGSTSSTAGSDMFDAEGYPWDNRIHSETRSRNADGTWRVRRGADKDLVAAVRLEFKNGAANAAELTDNAAPPPPVADKPADPLDPATLGFGTEPSTAAAPPPPAANAPAALDPNAWPTAILGEVTPENGAVTLFMKYAMGLIGENKCSSDDLLAVINAHGLTSLVGVGAFPDKIPAIVADVQKRIGA